MQNSGFREIYRIYNRGRSGGTIRNSTRCFTAHLRNCDILLRVNNSTALAHINRMDSIKFPRLSDLTRKIWSGCTERNLFICAAYIPPAQNSEADTEYRIISEETEWTLHQSYFAKIDSYLGPFDIDLFARSINTKGRRFGSWFSDPTSSAVDASSLNWSRFYFYAFPPFIFIRRGLRKIINDRAEGVVVVP